MTATVAREPWHRRAGARLSAGPGRGIARSDGRREATRQRRAPANECFRCTADRRKLTPVRIVAGGTTLGTTLLCSECLAELTPLDPDPLFVEASA